jgi:transcriptional regulator with XRE-family HTH domain
LLDRASRESLTPMSLPELPTRPAVGALLQHWRKARHLSQLALATEAEISPRHLCFLERGRARPSREMVLLLASVLDVPLRERNALLLAAGFAPVYPESSLGASELGTVKSALDAILRQQEPFPAVVLNRRWDVVTANQAARRFFGFLLGEVAPSTERPNLLRRMLSPTGLRPFVTNWDVVAEALVRRVHREAVGGVEDDATKALLAEVLDYPDVRACWRRARHQAPLLPVVPVMFRKDARAFHYFSTVTTLGTPQDVTAQELRIECFFPADPATAEASRQLALDSSS